MIRNFGNRRSLSVSFFIAMIFHMVALIYIRKNNSQLNTLDIFQGQEKRNRINNVKIINQEEVEKLRKVGVKGGAKNKFFQPDQIQSPQRPMASSKLAQGAPTLTLGNLKPKNLLNPNELLKTESKTNQTTKDLAKHSNLSLSNDTSATHFYFNPKKEKKIARNSSQDELKQEVYKNVQVTTSNPVAQKLSNFEIRYERPEGVSEDELNSDEKAYYSFFKRSYANYLSKLYATYDKVAVERPGIEKDFEGKHLLIGKIDYDELGNIVTIKILKSSQSDDIHYFFEETLKQLNLPNPPKSFIKNKKSFSTYYQIQIN